MKKAYLSPWNSERTRMQPRYYLLYPNRTQVRPPPATVSTIKDKHVKHLKIQRKKA